jgi:transcriptional regulator of aromatic amino acid metabolism
MNVGPCLDVSLDSIPVPILVVDEDAQVVTYNKAASQLVKNSNYSAENKGAGDLLHCLNSFETAKGCGSSSACDKCIIRNSITECFTKDVEIHHKVDLVVRADKKFQKMVFLVSINKLRRSDKKLALLVIKDLTGLLAQKEIIPICMHCRKLRDADQQWHRHEDYLDTFLNLKLSHCICESCVEIFYPGLIKKHQ